MICCCLFLPSPELCPLFQSWNGLEKGSWFPLPGAEHAAAARRWARGLGTLVRGPPWKWRGSSLARQRVLHPCLYSLLCLQRPVQKEKAKAVKMCNRTLSPVNACLILCISGKTQGSPVFEGARRYLLRPVAVGLL